MKALFTILSILLISTALHAKQYHVALTGNDSHDGTEPSPLRTISKAASLAQPGDTVTVHQGIYREEINPPRGGTSEDQRIVYQAAPGENATIKGSEPVMNWKKLQGDTWQVILPNSFFGKFNPFSDEIHGDWFNPKGRKHHTGAVYLKGHWLTEAAKLDEVLAPIGTTPLWFASVDEKQTTIWAQFKNLDPNQENTEINVRQSVFYPRKTGINYITVRGFTLEHAATPWSPPTAEQIGLIGTHWSKGWIIENNHIGYSTCTGVTLGKHGDKFDNTSQNSAEGYVETIKRGMAAGWSKENIGSHIVRNNHIHDCEQSGIVGSLGAIFSVVTGNDIHDIHVRHLFNGAEQAGIKFHGAIDTLISHNHVYRTGRGIWLDWMNQGTRVTGNLLHDNDYTEDLFIEVNHGPFMVDHNLFLSAHSLLDISQGCTFAHNLFAGSMKASHDNRQTPYHKAHSTELAGLHDLQGGDNRFHNNIFLSPKNIDAKRQYGLNPYDPLKHPCQMSGNVFFQQAKPSKQETNPIVLPEADTQIKLLEESGAWFLEINFDESTTHAKRQLVSTELLGKSIVAELPYEQADGSPYRLDIDYFGNPHHADNPAPGPFANPKTEKIQVWPRESK